MYRHAHPLCHSSRSLYNALARTHYPRLPKRCYLSSEVKTYTASPDAPRQVPTPLAFVRSSMLDGKDHEQSSILISTLATRFARSGYTCLEIDQPLSVRRDDTETFGKVLDRTSDALNTAIKSSENPFPPVLISHGISSLITQAYVSSFSATALILISPPPTILDALSILLDQGQHSDQLQIILKQGMSEFNFEARFPVAVFAKNTVGMRKKMETDCRLVKEGADLVLVNTAHDGTGMNWNDLEEKMGAWMDEIGV